MYGLHYLDFATLLIYLIGITIVGLVASRGVNKSIDYFMGGRKFGKAVLIMHAFGTGTHTDAAVNVVGASYKLGLAGIWYAWLPLFVTPFYWVMMPLFRRMRYITTADFFDERFGLGLGRVYSLFGIFYYILSMGIMLEGTGKMASGVTGGALSTEFCIIVMSVLFLLYGLLGGLQAAVWTDFVQGIFIIILSFILWPYMMDQLGGFSGMHEILPIEKFSLAAPNDPPVGYDRITVWFVVILTINTIFNIPGQPHTMEMGGSGKTELEGRVGFTYGNIIKRFCTIAWAFIGVGAIALYPDFSDPELIFGQATRDLLPVGLVGVMLASMIAAVMSSCDSFMVDGSALFVENIYRPLARERRPSLFERRSCRRRSDGHRRHPHHRVFSQRHFALALPRPPAGLLGHRRMGRNPLAKGKRLRCLGGYPGVDRHLDGRERCLRTGTAGSSRLVSHRRRCSPDHRQQTLTRPPKRTHGQVLRLPPHARGR